MPAAKGPVERRQLGEPASLGHLADGATGQQHLARPLPANLIANLPETRSPSGQRTSTSVVASGNITDKLSLRYGVGVFEPANTIALRYQLTKRLYLEAASGLASSLDLFFKRDF